MLIMTLRQRRLDIINNQISNICKRGVQVKLFTVHQNVEKRRKCFLTKFELFTSCRFQDIAVQSQQVFMPFCQYCDRRVNFGKLV